MAFGIRTAPSRLARAAWQIPAAAVLGVVAVTSIGVRPELVGFLYLAVITPELCRTDMTEHRLPNALVLPGYLAAATGLAFGWLRSGEPPLTALLACCATFAFLIMLSLGGGMGMGDVKLGGLLGLNLGVVGVAAAIAGPALGFVTGGVAGLVALVLPGEYALRRIPFGPYLLLGFWLATAFPLFVPVLIG